MAEFLNESLIESMEGGFLQYDLTRTYQVITSDRLNGVGTVLSDAGLPLLGQPLIVNGVPIWCVSRSPSRINTEDTARQWTVACRFTNQTGTYERDKNGNPTTKLDLIVPKFSISFQEVEVDCNTARLVDITKADGTPVQLPPNLRVRSNEGLKGPVTNSAGMVRPATRKSHLKVLKYSFYARDWDNAWDDLIDHTNSTVVEFKQTDVDGERLSQSYGINKLLLNDVIKDDIWREGRLWFRVTFVMIYNRLTWRHFEPDKGDTRRIFADQYKADGTQYTQNEVDDIGPYQTITTTTEDGQEATLGEPVKLNGFGAEIPRQRPESYDTDESFTVNFDKYDSADLATAMGLV